jgi:hypothetical protein
MRHFYFFQSFLHLLISLFFLSFVWHFHRLFKSIFSSSTYVLLSNLFSLLHFIEAHVCWGVVKIHFLFFFLFLLHFFETQNSCNILMCICDVQFFSHIIRHDVLCNMSFYFIFNFICSCLCL